MTLDFIRKLQKKHIAYAASGIGATLLLILVFRPTSQSVEVKRVERGIYEQIIQEDGITRVREKYTLLSPYSGQLRRVERHAGDSVRRGDVLAYVLWDTLTPLLSPESGVILRVLREDAGPIEMGHPIMEIGNTAALEIVVDVLSSDAVNVHKGDPVRIMRWGGPSPLDGKVRVVEPEAAIKISSLGVEERRVHVITDITTPRDHWSSLGHNFRLECHIVIFREEKALKVHTGALFRDGEGWAVYKLVKGKAKKMPVKIARRGPLEAMIEAGVNEGDEVVLYPGDAVKEGSRVREM